MTGAGRRFSVPPRAAWGLERMPPRAEAIVAREHRRAEWRIAMIQSAIVLFFGTLYFLAPKAGGSMSDLRPVPVAIAAMTLAIAGRVLVTRVFDPLPRLLVFTGITLDIAVVIGLVWSFHLQYGQPPAFYLKAPTQLYLFMVIALHGLSLEPLRVAFAGLVAALGWLFLTLYALDAGGMEIITRDFVAYMSGPRVLVGAEVDRIIAILAFAAVLSLVIASARAQMLMAALGVSAANELSRFFAAGLADRIAGAESEARAGMAAMKDGAVLTVDIRGFTRLAAETPPEDMLQLLSGFQERVVKAIRQQGGAIDKFLGDGALATFGCVQDSATPAADALRAALALERSVALWNEVRTAGGLPPVLIGAAVAAGPLLFGTVGFGDRLEFTVIGDPANRSAKLEKHNKVLHSSVVTDGQTFALAQRQGFEAVPRARHTGEQVAGIDAAVDVVVLA